MCGSCNSGLFCAYRGCDGCRKIAPLLIVSAYSFKALDKQGEPLINVKMCVVAYACVAYEAKSTATCILLFLLSDAFGGLKCSNTSIGDAPQLCPILQLASSIHILAARVCNITCCGFVASEVLAAPVSPLC